MKTPSVIRQSLTVLFFGVAIWFYAKTYFRPNWGWPLALAFGFVYLLVLIFIMRRAAGRPAPFQLVLRLANDNGGDAEDDGTFKKLHDRFTKILPRRGSVWFAGFDTDNSWIWFYFYGPNDQAVREAVMPQIQDCKIRNGSYFLSAASQACAPPSDGPALQL